MGLPRTLGCAVLAVLISSLAACTDDQPSFSDDLADYGPIVAEQVVLDDGTELAIGARGEEEFAAQWRAPGGEGWTAPQTVVEGAGLEADQLTVTPAGGTVVAGFSWYDADDDERENHARVDAAACHDLSCVIVEDVLGAPMLDAAGAYAAVELEREGDDDTAPERFATWESGASEWDEVELDGLPVPSEQFVVPDVVLLGDGSFATVRGSLAGTSCSYELWLSEPRGTTLAPVASTSPRPDPGCSPEFVQTDGTYVTFYDRTTDDDVSFVQQDGTWVDDQPTSGLLEIDDREGRAGIAMNLTELEDGSSVAVGSPDLVRVVAQYRPAGSAEWTRPVTVARSTSQRPCRTARSSTMFEHTDVMYVVSCWPINSAWGDEYDDAPPPTSGFALASADGRRWAAAPLDRPGYEPVAQVSERLLLARGSDRSVVWRPGATRFEEVTLPLAEPTVDAIAVSGDTAVRVTGNADPARPCRPTWSVAPLTAGAWQEGGAILPIEPFARGPNECYGVASDEEENGRSSVPGREIRVAGVIESINGSVDGTLVRTPGGWRFRRG